MSGDMPINHRVKWTTNELNQLLKETNKKIDINKIAENHKRTVGAIKFRLVRYAIKLIEEEPTTSLKHIQILTNLSREELLEGFEKIKYNFIEEEEITEDIYIRHINNIYYSVFLLTFSFIFHLICHHN